MDFSCVSNCYVFKSRLQEYAQKKGFLTPVYDTVKEGPSHEPCFRSAVIVNEVRYNSLPGFFNRKASEQSAAEVALLELAKAEGATESISYPVHETGLCKNLLQEYAQKMNYAIPNYVCHKGETQERKPLFTCTVDIGGIQYVGAAARSKKEAEIKAARTALLAIQSNPNGAEAKSNGGLQLTVLPGKKKVMESETKKEETKKALKPKKQNLKKKWLNRKRVPRNPTDQNVENMDTISQNGGSTTDMGIVSGAQTSDVVNEAEMGNNSVVINFNQGDENVAKIDNVSQNGGSTLSMEIVSGVQASEVVNEAVVATQEARKVDHGDENVANMDNISQNGGSTTQEVNKVGHSDEHVIQQLNQTDVVSVAELDNSSQNGKTQAMEIVSGDVQVGPVVALEVPVLGSESNSVHLNGNEAILYI